ncbi:transposase [Amycolatopsis sulphurea]|uniref:Transposase n=1 Tax=Amycolatopsis sulphurea TaxID=76022 RepID=A0A2A9FDC5_9PSEU|nr:transposase [Amycolatopsis sulphurea]PFG48490.1 transposase [Amycolatopsis sulphurea]
MVMKHYPPEFKAEAVALYRSRSGALIRVVAEDLGVNAETLRNWIRIDDGRRTGSRAEDGDPGGRAGPGHGGERERYATQAGP